MEVSIIIATIMMEIIRKRNVIQKKRTDVYAICNRSNIFSQRYRMTDESIVITKDSDFAKALV
jgi:predicted nuclease of predicted toxin-antitoxin system